MNRPKALFIKLSTFFFSIGLLMICSLVFWHSVVLAVADPDAPSASGPGQCGTGQICCGQDGNCGEVSWQLIGGVWHAYITGSMGTTETVIAFLPPELGQPGGATPTATATATPTPTPGGATPTATATATPTPTPDPNPGPFTFSVSCDPGVNKQYGGVKITWPVNYPGASYYIIAIATDQVRQANGLLINYTYAGNTATSGFIIDVPMGTQYYVVMRPNNVTNYYPFPVTSAPLTADCTPFVVPQPTLTVSGLHNVTIAQGSSATLVWTVANSTVDTVCTGTADWFGTKSRTGGSEVQSNIQSQKLYGISCQNSQGTGTDSVLVDVSAPDKDFTVTVVPASQSITQGGIAHATVSVQSLGSYSGNITLATSCATCGSNVTLNSLGSLTMVGNDTQTVMLNMTVATNATAASYPITVTGTGLNTRTNTPFSRSGQTNLTVNPPPPPSPVASPLILSGTFVANGGFVLQRDLGNANTTTAAEQFNERPDFFITILSGTMDPVIRQALIRSSYAWQEVNP